MAEVRDPLRIEVNCEYVLDGLDQDGAWRHRAMDAQSGQDPVTTSDHHDPITSLDEPAHGLVDVPTR